MRHRKTVMKLGRTAAHRKATMANLSVALFEKKHIKTTEAKAKATRRFSERLITLAKKDTVHARRLVMRQLRQKKIIKILFEDIVPRYSDQTGGYTRIVKLGHRQGDGASMAVIELVGYEMASKKKKEKEVKSEIKKKKRSQVEKVGDESSEKEIKTTKGKKTSEKKNIAIKEEKTKKKPETKKTEKKEKRSKKSENKKKK